MKINKINAFLQKHPKWEARLGQILRFGIVGAIASAIHYIVYYLMLSLVNPNIAFTCGYGVGFVCNYFLTTFFTFRSRPSSGNAVGFSFSHIINYLLEMGLLNLFLWLNIDKLLAPILVMIIVVPINFSILYLVYTYRKKS